MPQRDVKDQSPNELVEPDRISDGVIALLAEADRKMIAEFEVVLVAPRSTLGHAAVVNARTQVGVKEDPMGSNCGTPHDKYVVWIAGPGVGCVPWCAYFVGWAFDTSELGARGRKGPWGKSGYVPWIYEWCRTGNRLVAAPEHGDVFFLNPTDRQHSHMGLVAGADPHKGLIYTCEGNWSDQVLSQLRNYHAGNFAFARM